MCLNIFKKNKEEDACNHNHTELIEKLAKFLDNPQEYIGNIQNKEEKSETDTESSETSATVSNNNDKQVIHSYIEDKVKILQNFNAELEKITGNINNVSTPFDNINKLTEILKRDISAACENAKTINLKIDDICSIIESLSLAKENKKIKEEQKENAIIIDEQKRRITELEKQQISDRETIGTQEDKIVKFEEDKNLYASQIELLNKKISELENLLQEYNSTIDEQAKKIVQQEQLLVEKSAIIESQKTTIEEVENLRLTDKRTIETQNAKIIELDNNNNELSNSISNYKLQISERDERIKELESAVDSLYNDLRSAIEHNNTLQEQNAKLVDENNNLHEEIKKLLLSKFNKIESTIEQLHQNVTVYYTSDDTIYNNVNDIKQGFGNLYSLIEKTAENNTPDKNIVIRNELISKISSNSWVNTIVRLNAYTKIPSFKVAQIIKNDIAYLGALIIDLYKSYNIDIIIPELLKDNYDSEKQEYANNETTWIAFLCDVNPAEYRGKVYDIIKAGYTIHNDDGTIEHHKPIIYYY